MKNQILRKRENPNNTAKFGCLYVDTGLVHDGYITPNGEMQFSDMPTHIMSAGDLNKCNGVKALPNHADN